MGVHRVQVPLRWVDLDAQGHANNAAVLDYLQEARVDFLLRGDNAHLLGNGVVVVGHQVEYQGPIWFSHTPLDVELAIGEVGASRFVLGYQLTQQGRPVARARTHLCLFDFEAGTPKRLSGAERAWFTDRVVELPPPSDLPGFTLSDAAHRAPLHVRWSDLDSYGHVNNTRFFDYIAEARIVMQEPLLAHAVIAEGGSPSDHTWMVVRQDMRYVGQLTHRLEPYEVRTACGAVGRTSLTMAAEIVDPLDGSVISRSTTVVVHGDAEGRPTPVPESLRESASRWPAEPGRNLL